MILPLEDVQVSRPTEQEALDEIVAEEDGNQEYLELSGTLTRIRGITTFGGSLERGLWWEGLSS